MAAGKFLSLELTLVESGLVGGDFDVAVGTVDGDVVVSTDADDDVGDDTGVDEVVMESGVVTEFFSLLDAKSLGSGATGVCGGTTIGVRRSMVANSDE